MFLSGATLGILRGEMNDWRRMHHKVLNCCGQLLVGDVWQFTLAVEICSRLAHSAARSTTPAQEVRWNWNDMSRSVACSVASKSAAHRCTSAALSSVPEAATTSSLCEKHSATYSASLHHPCAANRANQCALALNPPRPEQAAAALRPRQPARRQPEPALHRAHCQHNAERRRQNQDARERP